MPNTPASFIAAAIRGAMRRPCSISSLASRICPASPMAACRIGEGVTAEHVDVLVTEHRFACDVRHR
jgi:hypothetical protein